MQREARHEVPLYITDTWVSRNKSFPKVDKEHQRDAFKLHTQTLL